VTWAESSVDVRAARRNARALLQVPGSIRIVNGLCVALAHMQVHYLTGLGIDTEKSCVVGDLYRLGIGIDGPIVGQSVFHDERDGLGGYVLEDVLLLYNRDLAALPLAVAESLFDMLGGMYALKVADGVVVLQIGFGIVPERAAVIEQNLAGPVDMNLLERIRRISGRLRNSRRMSKTNGDSYTDERGGREASHRHARDSNRSQREFSTKFL
jgi:hypothetical protein